MANSWAVVVGINHYEHLPQDDEQQLRCAVRDAERMQEFLCQQAGFDSENVVLCTDTSPAISGLNTRPSRTNLRRLLLELHKRPQAKGADMVWFFYSGHGISQEGQDYLLMQDGYPEDLAETAVPLRFVLEKLIECRAKTTVLVLDMCRNSATSAGKGGEEPVGMQTIREAQQQGIITLFSCSRGGRSYELPELGQGVFTYALLEGLGKHTLPGQLGDYLRQRVYELTQHHRPVQVPLIALEPDWRYNLPLLPTCVTKTDINHLKERANHVLFVDQNLDLAEQLWEQVNDLATNAEDKKLSRRLLREIDRKRTASNADLPNSTSTNYRVGGGEETGSKRLRLEKKRNNLQSEWDIRTEKLSQMRQALAIEVSITTKFQLKEQIRVEEEEIKRLESELFEIEQFLEINRNSSISQIPFNPESLSTKRQESEDNLSSEKGVDYRKLRDFLKVGRWKEADNETVTVMHQAANCQEEGGLKFEDIENLPCVDLQTVDQLWVKYSNGRFGFSVQKKIYTECGAQLDGKHPGDEIWEEFCDRVGWRKNGNWLSHSQLNSSSFTRRGCFPGYYVGGGGGSGEVLSSLLSHRGL